MAEDYRRQQDQILQEIEDRKAESIRLETLLQLKSLLVTRGADLKSIDQVLKAMRALANVRNKTDAERQADYDGQVGRFLEEMLGQQP